MSSEHLMPEVQQRLQTAFSLQDHPDKTDFINHLALEINRLILEDFEKLVFILYRLDINEDKLRDMLKQYVHEDAGYIIAQLIIERELQKAEHRKAHKKDENISPEDKW